MRNPNETSTTAGGTGDSSSNHYVPELDGLRCIAVLGVVLFHLRVPGMSIGGLGVWLFFVLSGYLITRILLAERSLAGGVGSYLGNFYARRVLRIFPLYYLYLFIVYAIESSAGRDIHGAIYFLTYTQNFLLGVTRFENQPGILFHTWSLAIEEQFYLIWPILVFYLPRRWLTAICVVAVLAAPIFREWVFATTGNPYLTYAALVASADALAVGCLCALHWDRIRSMANSAMGLWIAVCAVLLVALVFHIGPERFWDVRDWVQHPAQTFVFSLASIMSAAILANARRFRMTALLRHPLPVHLGKISYGIYMWHGLAIAISTRLLGYHSPSAQVSEWMRIGVSLLVTYLIAIVSYQYFERHFLRMKSGFYARKELAAAS